jgi:hypothetical protein
MSRMDKKRGASRIKNRQVGVMSFPLDAETSGPSPLESFPKHAELIAYIIAEWSQIEYKLAIWLAMRLSTDQHIVLPMVYTLETSRARLDLMACGLRRLLGDDPQVRGKLDKLLNNASEALNLRNKYAHAHFGPDADSQELAIAGMGKKAPINIPEHELKEHFRRMKELSHTLGVVLAAELGLPLKGVDAPDSVPNHPLGKHAVHTRPAQPAQPQSSEGIPEVPPASGEPRGAQRIGYLGEPEGA